MDIVATLTQALVNVNQNILDITDDPSPDYSINGQSISWSGYLTQLLTQQEKLSERQVIAQGPGEYVQEGIT